MNRCRYCRFIWGALFLLADSLAALAKMTPEQIQSLPPPAAHQIDFTKEIKPILETSCMKCHGRGKSKGELRIDTRETFLKGGESGPAVVPGKSEESLLIELVAGLNPESVMPKKGSKLNSSQIALLRAWIDQGVRWDDGVNFGKLPPMNLKPANPVLPVGSDAFASRGAIDMILDPYLTSHGYKPGPPVDDRVYARRVYLDIIGLLPPPAELERFVADEAPDKRLRLIQRLLADNQRYAEHWLTFWNDLLRNDYRGTGYIDGGRKQITSWLYEALATNKRYDRFVAELINPSPESEGFAKGIVWRGVINASQTPQMQAAQNISQVFMGVNLKCASCHDSFINDWTLADAYGLASIYADEPLEMVQCDKPTGHKAAMKFIYPELGEIDPNVPKTERLRRLAEIITQRQDARLTRTIVNRLWARFMGRGLVEPVDDMENRAWSPELLDWLAADLAENRYNLKKTIERILTSRAYQLPAVPASEQNADYVFRGPSVRRMSAEQYLDALSSVTGVWAAQPAGQVDFSAGKSRDTLWASGSNMAPKWIWNDSRAAERTEPGRLYFRKEVTLAEQPTSAIIVIATDNRFRLWVNGKEAGSGKDLSKPTLIDLRPHLTKGANLLALAAVNEGLAPENKDAAQANPAGLVCYARVRAEPKLNSNGREQIMDFASDASWLCSTNKTEDWDKLSSAANDWKQAVVLGDVGMAPWNIEKNFVQVLSTAEQHGRVRASLVNADPLMSALGRPNREQVLTTRSSVATTLQGLELTNGRTLAERLKKGADNLAEGAPTTGREFVEQTYQRALGRNPTAPELRVAEELVGTPVRREGIEDLLWAIAMLPEFQLIL
ncbi:MAG: DUF1549 domain-containing protein [Verrucomicrobiales bacterium]|nr:DUF1549 domain-containing protein [Verrucomicrobiales bacterium]